MRSAKIPSTSEVRRRVEAALDAAATDKSRKFWNAYLKGALPFRGVPMAGVRRVVHEVAGGLDATAARKLALALFEGEHGEDKLAGILILAEILGDRLGREDLADFARLFDRGLIADWSTCDWFCVKVLAKMIERDLTLARDVCSWSSAPGVWRRRASNVAFVYLAPRGEESFTGFTRLMLATCDVTVRSPERFAQTGVGWLLRELAEAEPDAVLVWTRAHLALMSTEAIRYVTERMPKRVAEELILARPRRSSGRSERRGRAPR